MKQKKKRIPESEQTHQKAIASDQAGLYTSCTKRASGGYGSSALGLTRITSV
jgi:hypothetical protein